MCEKTVCKIALTGGPCGGKTTAIAKIKEHFTARGYRVLVVSEVATDLICGGVSPTTCGTNKDFQEAQVALQISKELAYEKAAESMPDEHILLVCDRGVIDNRAYMTDEEFRDIVYGLGYSPANLLAGYHAVFHMETAAAVAYTKENNAARSESREAALALDAATRRAWEGHAHFRVIENKPTFEEKTAELLAAIEEYLHALQNPTPPREDKKVVLAIGRWMPLHIGHKEFLIHLAKTFDRLVVGIGSCYENGTARNCIPAVEREILLRKVFRAEGIADEKIEIIPIPDRASFEEWINDVIVICERYAVTHFCTGNKEDILDVLAKKNIALNLEMINPEVGSAHTFHATDVRNAILAGDTEGMKAMLPPEIIDAVVSQVAREVVAANCGQGREFIPGKQTVDIALFSREANGETYVLLGDRCAYKRDFAGYPALPGSGILEHESAITAALRVLRLETGVDCHMVNRAEFPMSLLIQNGLGVPAEMHFVNLFASSDMQVNGTMGGASQCFAIVTDGIKDRLTAGLYSRHDLENLRWVAVSDLPDIEPAYEQKSMIYEALALLSIPCPEECFDVLHEDGRPTGKQITRKLAHRTGALHGAAHVCIIRHTGAEIEILMQKRSENKDSFPGCYDLASAGHCEAGQGFLETALKELGEELGLHPAADRLEELFDCRISTVDTFRGELFHNEEICRVYVLEADVDVSAVSLQPEEVEEVRWFPLSYVAKQTEAANPLFCTNPDEFRRIVTLLS